MDHTTPNPSSSSLASTVAHVDGVSVDDILSQYQFSQYEYRTLFTRGGRMTNASMLVQHPADPNDRYIVMANYETLPTTWTVQCPRGKERLATLMIEAVRARIAVNRSQRLVAAG